MKMVSYAGKNVEIDMKEGNVLTRSKLFALTFTFPTKLKLYFDIFTSRDGCSLYEEKEIRHHLTSDLQFRGRCNNGFNKL